MISEQLRATLLSLKQISDRLKLLNTNSITKSEALAYKNEIIAALGDIDFTEIIEALDSIDEKIDDISTVLGDVAKQGPNQNATLSEVQAQATSAATDAAAAKTAAQAITGYATETNATANKNAIIAQIQANAGIPTLTIPDSTASQELAPNTLYVFTTRTSTLTLTLGTPIVGIANEYHFFVVCGSTAPTINFPAGITWNGGSAPTIAADKTYEVSILNNVAAYFEV